jgi:hypothetical protein
MLRRRLYLFESFRKSDDGLAGIPFGQSRDEVRISGTEMAVDAIMPPRQAKNLYRPRAAGAISVAVKPPVEKHMSRLDLRATSKAGFYKGAGQNHARISFHMTVAWGRAAAWKCLEPNLN